VIPVSEPFIGERERSYVEEALRSGWISQGRFVDEFERSWAKYCGALHGVAVSNGTAALQLAVEALSLPPGSEVILPSFTIISCAIAVLRAGLRPVLVDCEPDTWCLDVAEAASKVSERVSAIMPVHMYGHMAEMGALMELARRHGLAVIEDAAEAHGAEQKGRRAGGIGTLGCFSFYSNKIITTGEGGMVVTSDQALAARARSLRNLCFGESRRFWHEEIGHNFRLSNVQAAIGLAQLERIEENVARKRRMAALYTEQLKGVAGLALPVERAGTKNVYWMFGIVLNESLALDAAALAGSLKKAGIETRPFFVGMHEQPALRARGLFAGERYPVTERLSRRGLYLPSGLGLSDAQIERVCEAVRTCVA
jgi:perosamine synthetase